MEVGSVHQLDHSKLPENILGQLRFIRAVMVSEKTQARVSVAFPSKPSLENSFGRGDENGQSHPNLDSVYTMELDLAESVLSRRIPFEEFAARRGTRAFWVNRHFQSDADRSSNGDDRVGDADGLAGWGFRKRIRFVMKRRDNDDEAPVSVEAEAMKGGDHGNHKEGQKPTQLLTYVRKKKKKTAPTEVPLSESGDKCHGLDSGTNLRWTPQRYELAEKSVLEILKAKGAVHGNPILRADLREEARKLIGDTGLLDHLLKHIAGKLAPGGKDRFRRRHNQQGTLEYWLESADLISIRKEAGIDDPYWIPPQGWKLGDSPTQDPVCARELKKLKEDVDKMKSEIRELSNEQTHDHPVGEVPECWDDIEKMKISLLMPLKAMHEKLLRRKAKIDEQLLRVSEALTNMEDDLEGPVVEATDKKGLITAAPVNEEATAGENSSEDTRQRLRSGFKTCSFSSPSSVCYSKVMPPPPSPSAVIRPIARKPVLAIPVSNVTGSEANCNKPSPTVYLPSVSRIGLSRSILGRIPFHPFSVNHTSTTYLHPKVQREMEIPECSS